MFVIILVKNNQEWQFVKIYDFESVMYAHTRFVKA